MAHHAPNRLTEADDTVLGNRAWPWFSALLILGAASVGLALLISLFTPGGLQRFGFSYLTAYAFVFALTLGSLFFVLITHLFRAGWCVVVRRIAEAYSRNWGLMAILFVPIAVSVLSWSGTIYPWAQEFDDHAAETYEAAARSSGSLVVDPHGEAGEAPGELAMEAAAADSFDHGHSDVGPEGSGASGTPLHQEAGHAGGDRDGVLHPGGHDAHAAPGVAASHAEGHDEHHAAAGYTGDTWADHDHAIAYFVGTKWPWFELPFWSARWVLYFGLLAGIAYFYHRLSVRQDRTADPELTNRREWWAPLSIIAFAVLTMLVATDLLLGLDPVWFSTMFGVIYFTNGITAALCVLILSINFLHSRGLLKAANTEHQHDLSKLLFAFVFFWGYTAFSQFMLIWYASLPETTYWFEMRGITGRAIGDEITDAASTAWSGWTWYSIFLLLGHLFFPFAVLLSRHVKRNFAARTFMAGWMLTMVYADMYWIVMPHYSSPDLTVLPTELLLAFGLLCFTVAGALRTLAKHTLIAKGDPRLHESLALDTEVWAPIYPKPAVEPKAEPGSTGHPTMA